MSDFEITDVWPPMTCTEIIMRAYKLLDGQGRINIRYPVEVTQNSGRVTIRYTSSLPKDAIHRILANLKSELIDGIQTVLEI